MISLAGARLRPTSHVPCGHVRGRSRPLRARVWRWLRTSAARMSWDGSLLRISVAHLCCGSLLRIFADCSREGGAESTRPRLGSRRSSVRNRGKSLKDSAKAKASYVLDAKKNVPPHPRSRSPEPV